MPLWCLRVQRIGRRMDGKDRETGVGRKKSCFEGEGRMEHGGQGEWGPRAAEVWFFMARASVNKIWEVKRAQGNDSRCWLGSEGPADAPSSCSPEYSYGSQWSYYISKGCWIGSYRSNKLVIGKSPQGPASTSQSHSTIHFPSPFGILPRKHK